MSRKVLEIVKKIKNHLEIQPLTKRNITFGDMETYRKNYAHALNITVMSGGYFERDGRQSLSLMNKGDV